MGRKKIVIEDLDLSRFKTCFTTVPLLNIEHIGKRYGIERGNLMFLDFVHLVAESIWNDEENFQKDIEILVYMYPHCFPEKFKICK